MWAHELYLSSVELGGLAGIVDFVVNPLMHSVIDLVVDDPEVDLEDDPEVHSEVVLVIDGPGRDRTIGLEIGLGFRLGLISYLGMRFRGSVSTATKEL